MVQLHHTRPVGRNTLNCPDAMALCCTGCAYVPVKDKVGDRYPLEPRRSLKSTIGLLAEKSTEVAGSIPATGNRRY